MFRVSATGGTPMAVSADRFTQEYWAAPSPTDANTVAFTGTGRTITDWWRKGHSHIDESQIWLVHAGGDTPRYEAVTTDDGQARVADVERRRQDAVLRLRQERRGERLGKADRHAAKRAA